MKTFAFQKINGYSLDHYSHVSCLSVAVEEKLSLGGSNGNL